MTGRAGLSQASTRSHFGSMEPLVTGTCRQATAEPVAAWAGKLEPVGDLVSRSQRAR